MANTSFEPEAPEAPEVLVLGSTHVGERAVGPGRQSVLLTLLALSDAEGRAAPVGELLRDVFVERADASLEELRIVVSRVRRRLRSCRAPSATILYEGDGYRLHHVPTDVARFEWSVDRALMVEAVDTEHAGELAQQALALWRGEPCAGALAAHPAMVRLVERRLLAEELAFRCAVALGRQEGCLADLLAACRRQPYAEELWRLAMVALYRSGRQAESLALYQEARRRLVEELGLEPGPLLRATEAQVLAHDGALELRAESARRRPPTIGSLPAGVWRGFPRARDSYITDPGVAERFMDALGEHRQLTVVGTAGVGKTRLVTEVLPRAAGRWPHGADFCELSQVGQADAVGITVAASLGVRVPVGMEPVDAVSSAIASQARLLVLDTCEHVIDGVGPLVEALLDRCPALCVVATSRAPLRVAAERLWPMAALEIGGAAVELFIERARQADPTFLADPISPLDPSSGALEDRGAGETAQESERQAIAALCARLDGVPLAIELAAPRVRALSVTELVDRLDRRFVLLRQVSGRAVHRHASLRDSFEWSYRSLAAPCQAVFRTMGAFAGPIALDAIEELAAAVSADPAAVVAELVDQSMVVARRSPRGTRYRLLDSLRAYARELLAEAGELDEVLARHAALVAQRKDALVARCAGSDEATAVDGLDELWPELRAAVSWALAGARWDEASALVAGLGAHSMLREQRELGGWANEALAMAEEHGSSSPHFADVLAATSARSG